MAVQRGIFVIGCGFLLGLFLSLITACSDSADSNGDPDGDMDLAEETPDGDSEMNGDSDGLEDGDEESAESDGDAEEEMDAEVEAEDYPVGLPPRPDYAPSLLVRPEDKDRILSRIEREPFKSILEKIRAVAERDHYDFPEPDTFDSKEQVNGETAQSAAFLAWLLDDETMAEKAREFMDRLSDNYESHEDFDIDIRLPAIMLGYTYALDLLVGAEMISAEEARAVETKLTNIADAFYNDYILDVFHRTMALYYTQNNHPIRTACSLAMAAIAFPEHPQASAWADWAFSELDYLWGPYGHYIQPDGGVSEGSLYYRFAFAPSLSLFLAYENRVKTPVWFNRNCVNRLDAAPWNDYTCVDGEPFLYENLLHGERFQLSVDWFLALRMPDGRRPPMEDSGRRRGNGGAILSGFMNRPDLIWDWEHDDYNMSGGYDLRIQHLAYVPDDMPSELPAYKDRVMYDAGQAVFRSGWEADDLWVLVTAEHGPVRKTVHDHVDAGSFTLSAYGEYLLIDPGYYKPDMSDNARTAQAASHNVLMIEEEPVPPKGLILNFGDADAFLMNESLGKNLSYVEAWQEIEISQTERHYLFVRNRYLVTADRIVTTSQDTRHHTWRLHGFSGYEEGGTFEIDAPRATWEMPLAGVDVYLAGTDPGLEMAEPPFNELEAPHVHEIDSDPHHHGVLDGRIVGVVPGYLAVVAPYRVGAESGAADDRLVVVAVSADGVTEGFAAWTVTHADGTDLFILRDERAPATLVLSTGHSVETDGELVMLTLEGEAVTLLARGSYLRLDGATLIENNGEPAVVVETP